MTIWQKALSDKKINKIEIRLGLLNSTLLKAFEDPAEILSLKLLMPF